MMEVRCDVCKKKVEGQFYSTVVTSGVNLSDGYYETTMHVCCECESVIGAFVKSITKE